MRQPQLDATYRQLALRRRALSSPPPCRFIPAHPDLRKFVMIKGAACGNAIEAFAETC